jgi:hypothetical protein
VCSPPLICHAAKGLSGLALPWKNVNLRTQFTARKMLSRVENLESESIARWKFDLEKKLVDREVRN